MSDYAVGTKLHHYSGEVWEVIERDLPGSGEWEGNMIALAGDYRIRCTAGRSTAAGTVRRVHADYLHGDGWQREAMSDKASIPSDRVSFFNEAAREAAVQEYRDSAVARMGCTCPWDDPGGPPADCRCDERERKAEAQRAEAVLTAALEALPERSKAILALAALSDEELVEAVAMTLWKQDGYLGGPAQTRERYRANARGVLTALGLPVAEREAMG